MDSRDEEIRDESSQLEPRPQARAFQAAITWRHHPAADVSSHGGACVGALVGVVCSEDRCVKGSDFHVSFTHVGIGTFVNNWHTEPKDFASGSLAHSHIFIGTFVDNRHKKPGDFAFRRKFVTHTYGIGTLVDNRHTEPRDFHLYDAFVTREHRNFLKTAHGTQGNGIAMVKQTLSLVGIEGVRIGEFKKVLSGFDTQVCTRYAFLPLSPSQLLTQPITRMASTTRQATD
jgi:hypothetical protein